MNARLVKFADCELDIERYQLRRAGEEVRLERLPMELLILLASRDGELVSRADMVRALWGGNLYRDTENGINTAVRKIRVALGDDPSSPRVLITVKGKGYRLDGIEAPSRASPDAAADAPAGGPPARLMVLPFANVTGDAAQDDFCDALANEASATLGMLGPERLVVIARTTAARYRGSSKSIAEIARELSLDYVLEGSLAREGARSRILATLVRCADQTQVWSRVHEPVAQGALDILKELGAALAADITPAIAKEREALLARRLPVDPAAHDAYLRGRYFWYRRVHFDAGFCAHHALSAEDFFRSRRYFDTAVERDPTYALGYCGLSNYYGSTVVHGCFAPDEGWPIARAMAERALELDPALPEAHHAMAAVHYFYDWDWRRAEAGFREALRLNPSHPESHRLYARLLLGIGRDSEGYAAMARAEKIDPYGFQGSRAFGLVLAGKHEDIVREYFSPGHREQSPLVSQLLAIAFEVRGLFEAATESTVEALTGCAEAIAAATVRSRWEAGGYDAVLQGHLDDLRARQRSGYTSPLLLAETFARLSAPDEMFHWLERALAERSSRLVELRTNPWFERYRTTGKFRAIVKQIVQ